MQLRDYIRRAVGDDDAVADMVTAAMASEAMELGDLPLLHENHLSDLCPALKMGPRLRLLKYIEEHPPPHEDSDGGTGEGDDTFDEASGKSAPASRTTSSSSSSHRVVSRRVSKSLLKAEHLTSVQFMRLWSAVAGNADRLEGDGVAAFLDMLLRARATHALSESELRDGRQVILDGFGTADGALEMASLQALLSVEECFLFNFRSKSNITSVDFMRIYMHYDEDGDGTIEHTELKALLRDLLTRDRVQADSVSKSLATSPDVLPSEINDYTEVCGMHGVPSSMRKFDVMQACCTAAPFLQRAHQFGCRTLGCH